MTCHRPWDRQGRFKVSPHHRSSKGLLELIQPTAMLPTPMWHKRLFKHNQLRPGDASLPHQHRCYACGSAVPTAQQLKAMLLQQSTSCLVLIPITWWSKSRQKRMSAIAYPILPAKLEQAMHTHADCGMAASPLYDAPRDADTHTTYICKAAVTANTSLCASITECEHGPCHQCCLLLHFRVVMAAGRHKQDVGRSRGPQHAWLLGCCTRCLQGP